MNKGYTYIGMVVNYGGDLAIVTGLNDKTVTLFDFNRDIWEVDYDEISTPNSIKYRMHNAHIRESQARYTGKFVKNNSSIRFDDGSKVWFTSDTHFGHDNIIRFCDRPFDGVDEMDRALIDNWNSCIGPDDTVFHLGDFCWGGSDAWNSILKQLNGHIHLILGNHDIKNIRQGYMQYFESVGFQSQIEVEGQPIYLNHYPFLTYGGVYRKQPVWQLFGHVHSKNGRSGQDSTRMRHLLPTQYDVGVDNNNYKPVNFNKIKEIITFQNTVDDDCDQTNRLE